MDDFGALRAREAGRTAFRRVPLDGALLWFQPATGLNVRLEDAVTAEQVALAPRAVMFGITNRCNLRCNFCSRPLDAESAWTVDTAFVMLRDLSEHGVLEVAFGGGEPWTFPGFDELLRRLGEETTLAVHVTTNGVLLNPKRLARIRMHVGELRLSIYDDNEWEERVAMLAAHEVRFGANVVVTAQRLPSLPALLSRLQALGCRDVALLRYVGPDPEDQLRSCHEARLTQAVLGTSMRVRLSVCFGDLLPRLERSSFGAEGDCGAGTDFAVITSDQRLQPCSFHGPGPRVETADTVLDAWRATRACKQRAPAAGCARPLPSAERRMPGLRVWQQFSANNSGDCVLVGRFEHVGAAREFYEELRSGFTSATPYSEEWRRLFEQERIPVTEGSLAPDTLARSGRVVLVHTNMAPEDDFPELRALLWRRRGRAFYDGIHEHDALSLVVGLRFSNAGSLEAARRQLESELPEAEFTRRALDLYGRTVIGSEEGTLERRLGLLETTAGAHTAALGAELIPASSADAALPVELARDRTARARERLWIEFPTAELARAFTGMLDGQFGIGGSYIVAEPTLVRPRLGWLVHRRGGRATVIDGEVVRFELALWHEKREQELDLAQVVATLRGAVRAVGSHAEVSARLEWRSVMAIIDTSSPCAVLPCLFEIARALGVRSWLRARPRDELGGALARIEGDLRLPIVRR